MHPEQLGDKKLELQRSKQTHGTATKVKVHYPLKYILFWKSALIMASRYPRERDEVDRKKRRAADTIHFLFP
jgi:hypothetical protein